MRCFPFHDNRRRREGGKGEGRGRREEREGERECCCARKLPTIKLNRSMLLCPQALAKSHYTKNTHARVLRFGTKLDQAIEAIPQME